MVNNNSTGESMFKPTFETAVAAALAVLAGLQTASLVVGAIAFGIFYFVMKLDNRSN